MSTNPNAGRKSSRGGRGRGRGGSGGGRRGRGNRSNKRGGDKNASAASNNSNVGNKDTNNNNATDSATSNNPFASSNNGTSQSSHSPNNKAINNNPMALMRDEEVLIAFMPFLKGDNQRAMAIHEQYQSDNDQRSFLHSARDFLVREMHLAPVQQPQNLPPSQSDPFPFASNPPTTAVHNTNIDSLPEQLTTPTRQTTNRSVTSTPSPAPIGSQQGFAPPSLPVMQRQELPSILRMTNSNNFPAHSSDENDDDDDDTMNALERKLVSSLLSDGNEDPVVSMPSPVNDPIAKLSAIGSIFGSGDRGDMHSSDAAATSRSYLSSSPSVQSPHHTGIMHPQQLHAHPQHHYAFQQQQQQQQQQRSYSQQQHQQHDPSQALHQQQRHHHQQQKPSPITPPRPPDLPMSMQNPLGVSPFPPSFLLPSPAHISNNTNNNQNGVHSMPSPQQQSQLFYPHSQPRPAFPVPSDPHQQLPFELRQRHYQSPPGTAPWLGPTTAAMAQNSHSYNNPTGDHRVDENARDLHRFQNTQQLQNIHQTPQRQPQVSQSASSLASARSPSNSAQALISNTTPATPSSATTDGMKDSSSDTPTAQTPPKHVAVTTNAPATPTAATTKAEAVMAMATAPTVVKKEFQPKRLWTRLQEQPGRIFANNVSASTSAVLNLRPRQELTAKWMLPLSYLRQRMATVAAKKNVDRDNSTSGSSAATTTIRDALAHLAVGLFRRGCTENGAQASIISKEILTPAGENRPDYPFQVTNNDTVVGTVPFYSPRTPGYVVFRLYWQNDPLETLATGPTLNVRVTEDDFESSIRFILSNFKAKKVNPTSLSSLNSFALVLEQFQLNKPNANSQHQNLEGAGRAVWGCICEARKVLDACASEYTKTTTKLQKLEEAVEELKAKVDEEEAAALQDEVEGEGDENHQEQLSTNEGQEPTPNMLSLREKQKALMSGRASCERKWRDSQLAFSSILKAVVTNPSISLLLRRELVTKMRLEYELWCPLCEEFAIPGTNTENVKIWYEPLLNLPHSINADHFRMCTEARSKMQIRILGFDPNTEKLENVLYQTRGRTRQMNPGAVNTFNQLSAAMGQLYHDVYSTADRIHQQREMIRSQTEKLVQSCDGFPQGTKVAIFGSSANGFGSPDSDLDMCLQIPQGVKIGDADDPSGSLSMAKLAKILEENGMKEVDVGRLTARIPVIKFNFPKPMFENGDDDDATIECDLSMHNPLAVLNTSLLRTYAEINPVTRVLASIIKRWARARDINNPARHTLSSYGYIIMLLHFLTFHQRSGNGLVSQMPDGSTDEKSKRSSSASTPLLPNLQWMDGSLLESSTGGSPPAYRELTSLPKSMMQHPLEENFVVNTYFYRPNGPAQLNQLQSLFPGQDLSLAILLASFFRYYAYEFDYKRHVVSLHSTASRGLVEREVKAELDGWRNYSAALTIEDPFETFYDVAHVLRGGYYHRIRREFAVAYSKIADVALRKAKSVWTANTNVTNSGNPTTNNASSTAPTVTASPTDISKMSGMGLVDWICEPISSDREEAA